MPGTLIIKGTIYAWNISNIGDQICLERFSMLLIEKRSRHIWSPMLLIFQAYIVLFIINDPGIYGTLYNHRTEAKRGSTRFLGLFLVRKMLVNLVREI